MSSHYACHASGFGIQLTSLYDSATDIKKKVNLYLPSLMMKVPDHLYV
jgi:hypothetical protein